MCRPLARLSPAPRTNGERPPPPPSATTIGESCAPERCSRESYLRGDGDGDADEDADAREVLVEVLAFGARGGEALEMLNSAQQMETMAMALSTGTKPVDDDAKRSVDSLKDQIRHCFHQPVM